MNKRILLIAVLIVSLAFATLAITTEEKSFLESHV